MRHAESSSPDPRCPPVLLTLAAAALLATCWPAAGQSTPGQSTPGESTPGESTPAQDLTELARQARDSVVLLTVFEPGGRAIGTGTGFFVEGGRLVTNLHVVDRADRIEAMLANEQLLEVTGVAAADEVNDLAILEVASGSYPSLTLADSAVVEAGERVVVLGNPLGLSGTLSEGIVSAIRTEGLGGESSVFGRSAKEAEAPLLQISAAISPGSSGSPVMNLSGEVIGVAVSQFLYGQNLNFAVPAAAVRELLRAADSGRLERRFRGGSSFGRGVLLRNVVLSLLAFAGLYAALRYWA